MKGKKIVSTLLALLLLASLPVSALAATWDIGNGDIIVNAGSGGQTVTQGGGAAVEDNAPVIKGSSTENTVTINAEKDQTANVTLSGANIDVSSAGKAAVSTTGEGNVNIELNGSNALKSGHSHAGLEKNNDGNLTIQDKDKDGSLNAKGGQDGAGIGGGSSGAGSDITITGGKVTARAGIMVLASVAVLTVTAATSLSPAAKSPQIAATTVPVSAAEVGAMAITSPSLAARSLPPAARSLRVSAAECIGMEMTSRSPAARSVPPEADAAQALAAALMHAAAETSRFPAMRS